MSTTLYIAGPMTSIPEFNYPAFHAAADRLRDADYYVLNPADSEADNPTPGAPQAWEWYLRRALRQVTQADGIALLPGWQESRGALLEVHVGEALGMRMWAVEQWVKAAAR